MKFIRIIFKQLIPTSEEAQYFSVTKMSWLMLLMEKIAVNLSVLWNKQINKYINTFCEQNAELLIVKAGFTCSYHWALKGYLV
jgi:uncharacterized membrane protein (UPF0182 family)